jgi:hypothetical protein
MPAWRRMSGESTRSATNGNTAAHADHLQSPPVCFTLHFWRGLVQTTPLVALSGRASSRDLRNGRLSRGSSVSTRNPHFPRAGVGRRINRRRLPRDVSAAIVRARPAPGVLSPGAGGVRFAASGMPSPIWERLGRRPLPRQQNSEAAGRKKREIAAARARWQGEMLRFPYTGRWSRYRAAFIDVLAPVIRRLDR